MSATNAYKWTGTALQIAGVFLLAGRVGAPSAAFIVMLGGSAVWVGAAWRAREWSALTLNLAFCASNLLGIYRWLAA